MRRRKFLWSAGFGGAAPLVVPGRVLGKDGGVAPSERVTLGCIGVGGQGSGNMGSLMNDDRVQVVSVCDVDAGHLRAGLAKAGLKERFLPEPSLPTPCKRRLMSAGLRLMVTPG